LIGAAGLCAVVSVACIVLALLNPWKAPNALPNAPTSVTTQATQMAKPINPSYDPQATYDPNIVPDEKTEYISPIDFAYLKSINPDIYAWIEVPGTKISYPVLQSATDDAFYLDHNEKKQSDVKGAVFSEHRFNGTDFSDAVTVLYGHNMSSKYQSRMFGELQALYWDEEFLRNNDEIVIYLPDRELHFEIFAALPFSRMHLLHYYYTEKQEPFELMIDNIYSTRLLNTVLLEDRRPVFGDQLVVLSTCLSGDNRYRYLVIGACKGNT